MSRRRDADLLDLVRIPRIRKGESGARMARSARDSPRTVLRVGTRRHDGAGQAARSVSDGESGGHPRARSRAPRGAVRPRRASGRGRMVVRSAAVRARMTTRRTLLVEDEPSIREVVRFHLELAGFDITEIGDGKRALDL